MAPTAIALETQLAAWVARHQMFAPGDRVAVAVSGGSDSVALLLLLRSRAEAWGLQLQVAHFNHGWRPESAAEADWVAALAARWQLPFIAGRAPEPLPPGNREQVARRLRYGFLQSLLVSGQANRIATGHTADDQAETVLLRLLRGASTAGLAAILAARDGGAIVRPLLFARRQQLRAWLTAQSQNWLDDPTNLDLNRRRNLLRQRWLPELAKAFNPALVERLGTVATVAAAEEAFWAEYLEPIRKKLFQPTPQGWRASRNELKTLPLAVQRRLLRRVLRQASPQMPQLDFADIEEIVGWLMAPARHPRRRHLAGVDLLVTSQWLELALRARL